MIDFGDNFIEYSKAAHKKAPIILCCPHSGKLYPEEFIAKTILTKKELRYSEDAFIDEIITLNDYDADFYYLKMNIPRTFVDVNRSPDEIDANMFKDLIPDKNPITSERLKEGFGVIPRLVKQGLNIYDKKLIFKEEAYRISKYHQAYHNKLKEFIDACKNNYNKSYILDFHSMPRTEPILADIVLGDNYQKSCDADFIEFIENFLINKGYKVWRNHPYSGGYTTYHYGKPEKGINALQIEICRGLYMKEDSIRRDNEEINELKLLFKSLLNILKQQYGT